MAGKRKGTYKITNWSKYNDSLVQRGSVTFWFNEDVISQWHHANAQSSAVIHSSSAMQRSSVCSFCENCFNCLIGRRRDWDGRWSN